METSNTLNYSTKSDLALNGRASLSVSGIKKIKTTENTKVVALLDNCVITIIGNNLCVQNISLSSGILELTGIIYSIGYGSSGTRKFSLKNLFK